MAVGTGLGSRSFADVKRSFFDADRVLKSMDRATARSLSRFGAFVRTRARSSIRKRKATSKPGSPPTDRTGPLKLIYFAYDPGEKAVVVGPVIFPSAKQKMGAKVLEHGGTVPGNGRVIFVTRDPGRDETGKFVTRGRKRVKLDGMLKYEPRPFMRPAFEAELPKAAELFRDSLR